MCVCVSRPIKNIEIGGLNSGMVLELCFSRVARAEIMPRGWGQFVPEAEGFMSLRCLSEWFRSTEFDRLISTLQEGLSTLQPLQYACMYCVYIEVHY